MKSITVLIIDDDPLLRALIHRLLKNSPDVKVIGSAENASAGLTMVKEQQPSLVILDIQLPDGNSQALVQEIKKASPPTRIYLCSAYPDEKIKTILGESGADGFVSKTNLKEGLTQIIASLQSF